MTVPRKEPGINSVAGLARAFRDWARSTEVGTTPAIAGASDSERKLIAALGGVAAEVAGDHALGWPKAARDWALSAPEPPTWLTEAVQESLGRGNDVLAALYYVCVSPSNRRRLGTVFTPEPVVEHMLDLVEQQMDSPPEVIVDPGAGVGAFTLAAARRWSTARIVAIDINVATLGLLGTRLAFEIEAEPDDAESLRQTQLVLGDYIDQLEHLYSSVGRDDPIAVIGNPPYTRMQQLPPTDRQKASDAAGGIIDSGHANLAMLFQAATLTRMRPRDASCLILPGSFSYTRASQGLRRALWQSNRRIDVHRWPATERAFTGRSVQAAILAVGPVVHRRPPLRLAHVALTNPGVAVTESWGLSRQAREPDNWFAPRTDRETVPNSVPLSSVATIRRGVATGSNDMFFVTDETAAVLPAEVVVAGIPTLRGFDDAVLDCDAHTRWGGPAARRWLLAIPPECALNMDLKNYLARFEHDVKPRHLPSQRKLWYSLPRLPRPPLLISPLSKSSFKVVINAVGAVPSNNLFGMWTHDQRDVAALASWLRSAAGQSELRRSSRRYPGGSYKLEPSDLASIQVPESLQRSRR